MNFKNMLFLLFLVSGISVNAMEVEPGICSVFPRESDDKTFSYHPSYVYEDFNFPNVTPIDKAAYFILHGDSEHVLCQVCPGWIRVRSTVDGQNQILVCANNLVPHENCYCHTTPGLQYTHPTVTFHDGAGETLVVQNLLEQSFSNVFQDTSSDKKRKYDNERKYREIAYRQLDPSIKYKIVRAEATMYCSTFYTLNFFDGSGQKIYECIGLKSLTPEHFDELKKEFPNQALDFSSIQFSDIKITTDNTTPRMDTSSEALEEANRSARVRSMTLPLDTKPVADSSSSHEARPNNQSNIIKKQYMSPVCILIGAMIVGIVGCAGLQKYMKKKRKQKKNSGQ